MERVQVNLILEFKDKLAKNNLRVRFHFPTNKHKIPFNKAVEIEHKASFSIQSKAKWALWSEVTRKVNTVKGPEAHWITET
jgi:hypothetical protein